MAERSSTHKPATKAKAAGGKAKGVTKMDGVRKAVTTLGKNATPLQIQGFLKEQFNLDMTREYISKYKNLVIKEMRKSKRLAAKAAATTGAGTGSLAPTRNGKVGSIGLDDLETVKDLVRRVGAASLKKAVDLLAQ
jgi:hypothetical protein